MKISSNILKKHIKNSDTIDWEKVWDLFTIRTAEVEGVEYVGKDIQGVVVGEILTVEDHPKSTKLHVLSVNIGKEVLQIVCGAPNVRVGLKVALIQVGGRLGEIEIAPRPLVGIESFGMCCSERELGMSDEHEGLIELPEEWVIGTDIKEYIPEIEDIVVEIDNKSLTNRPDLWGHYGIAREIAAITNHELNELELYDIVNDKEDLDINIINSDLCYRYSGIKLDNVSNGKTPLWMKIFLFRAGMRSISLIVDLTNYIMLELGQPMHAFDSRSVANIEVGLAKDEDKFTTLDGIERTLTNETLMIKNNNKYFAIAGIMGGLDSEILPDTNSLILESACFEASCIRKSSTKLGLRTEASARYEKSLDPNLTEIATKRFIQLLSEYSDVVVASNLTDVYPNKLEEKEVLLTNKTLTRYMGKELDKELVVSILSSLGMKVSLVGEDYSVIVPTYRVTKDISIEADLIEEISRMYGYENFATVPLKLDLTFKEHECVYNNEYELKKYLVSKFNLSEVHTYLWYKTSFLKQINVEKENVNLMAKSEDSILRDDLALSLVEIAKVNFKNMNSLGIFELGTEIRNNEDNRSISILLGDDESNLEVNYNKAKSIVSSMVKELKNKECSFVKENSFYYNVDGYSLAIMVDDIKLGYINIVHPKIVNSFSKKKSIVTINIDFKLFDSIGVSKPLYKEISKYPTVELDYTIIASKTTLYTELEDVLNKIEDEYIVNHKLVDMFINEDEVKYTFRYYLVSEDRTLDSNDLDAFRDKVLKTIKDNNLKIVV